MFATSSSQAAIAGDRRRGLLEAHVTAITLGRGLASLLVTIAICASPQAARAGGELDALAWLTGCWQMDGAEPGSGEQWSRPAGGTMLGTSRTVKNGRTVDFEFMQFRYLDDGTLAFIAQPSGRAPTVFRLLQSSPVEAVFENPAHDFPQRITYATDGERRLRARIEGLSDGKRRAYDFPMQRISCELRPTENAGADVD